MVLHFESTRSLTTHSLRETVASWFPLPTFPLLMSSFGRCEMPIKSSGVDVLADTSVAVAVVVEDHEHHATTLRAIGDRRVGLAGHAEFETFSVLTRLPPPARRSPETVVRLMRANFLSTHYLATSGAESLLARFASLGIAGGAVYDALVGAAAQQSGLVLLTRDARALPVYRALQIDVEVIRG